MFRERVINRQDENKARTSKREREREVEGWRNGRTDKSRSLCPAKVTSVVYSSQTKIVKEFRDQRPRHLSSILKARRLLRRRRLPPVSAFVSPLQLHPSPGHRHPRDFTSRRVRVVLWTCREKCLSSRETSIIIMIRFNSLCHAD